MKVLRFIFLAFFKESSSPKEIITVHVLPFLWSGREEGCKVLFLQLSWVFSPGYCGDYRNASLEISAQPPSSSSSFYLFEMVSNL